MDLKGINAVVLNELMQPMMDDSDSSLSDDELILAYYNNAASDEDCKMKAKPRKVDYVENIVPTYDLKQFKNEFKMSKYIVYFLIERFAKSDFSAKRHGGPTKTSDEKAFLLALWYLINEGYLRHVAERFDVSLSTAHTSIMRVLNFIISLSNEYIKWPGHLEISKNSHEFKKKSGIENILGVIDACHVQINKPKGEKREAYINNKGYCSILLQGIVNPNMLFIDVCCGEPGSLDNSSLLKKSGIFTRARDPKTFGNNFLLGNSAYPSLTWLVPPIKDNGALEEEQQEFNFIHSVARRVAEDTFGVLIGRFRRLHKMEHLDISISVKCIMAACVLHNICILKKDSTKIEMARVKDILVDNGDDDVKYTIPM